MKSAAPSDQITTDNRHQYFETAFASPLDLGSEVSHSDARGRQRREAKKELKQVVKRAALGVLALVVCAVIVLVAWKIKPH